MSFESFYGGRRGASFVIVKTFDGVNIASGTPKGKYLAVTNDRQYFIWNGNFIEKTRDNYTLYNWEYQLLDGSIVQTKTNAAGTGATVNHNLPVETTEGMVQCFAQGGNTTNQVNYGEYVIIDTPDKQNPDNGKVYRRGMDLNTSLAGAEYVGQIVGPSGSSPQIDIDHYEDVKYTKIKNPEGNPNSQGWYEYNSVTKIYSLTSDTSVVSGKDYYKLVNYTEKEYDEVSGDLVPGSVVNSSTGVRTYNDKIKWIYADVKDEAGNITGCVVGFKLPTLVIDFEASSINPYNSTYRRGSGTAADPYYYTNLISEDSSQYVNGKWTHPFYEKWQVKVPQGIHGDDSTNIEVIHTMTMPAGHKKNFAGTSVYTDAACTIPYTVSGSPLVLTTSVNVLREAENNVYRGNSYSPIYDVSTNSCKISYGGNTLYVKKEDCYVDVVRYRETSYDNYEDGEIRFYYIGELNQIQRITLSENGILTAFYSNIGTQILEEVVRWINNVNLDNHGTLDVIYNTLDGSGNHQKDTFNQKIQWIDDIDLNNNGTLTVEYNTLDNFGNHNKEIFNQVIRWIDNSSANGIQLDNDGTVTITYNTLHDDGTGTMVHDQEVYPQILDWITNVTLDQQGNFDVLFNNSTIQSGHYHTTLNWIDYVDILANGTVNFYFNSNHNLPAFSFTKKIKYLDNIDIQTVAPGSILEGSGDQKVHVVYNTDTTVDNPIGNPLNYIIETAISEPSASYPNAPYRHLLVYYADPALRASMSSQHVTYPSQKYPGQIWTEWVDLGDIEGSKEGLRILEDVANLNDLKDSSGNWIPPEQLKNSLGVVINPNAAGWAVTYTPIGATSSSIYCFDYNNKVWYYIGTIVPGSSNPEEVIEKSTPVGTSQLPNLADVALLKDKGFWFAEEVAYSAK